MPMMLKSMIKMTSLGLFLVPAIAMAQSGDSSKTASSTKADNRPKISQEEYEPASPPTAEEIELRRLLLLYNLSPKKNSLILRMRLNRLVKI